MRRYAERILEFVSQSKGHPTAEQIFLELKKTEPKVVQATIYNNLNALCRKGLIRKLPMEGSPDRYDTIRKHDHLVCRQCGELSDIEFEDLTGALEQKLGKRIFSYDLKVYCLCENCRETERKEKRR